MTINEKELREKILNVDDILQFHQKFPILIDRGKLAEFYCKVLFNIEGEIKSNTPFDGKKDGKNVEIKVRKQFTTEWPPSYEIKEEKEFFDLLYYVEFNSKLLPKRIVLIKKEDVIISKGKTNRVQFKQAFDDGKIELVYHE